MEQMSHFGSPLLIFKYLYEHDCLLLVEKKIDMPYFVEMPCIFEYIAFINPRIAE